MSRRSRQQQAISLFSFQDIISTVTAVIILIALILSIELVSRSSKPAAASDSPIEETEQELERQVKLLTKKKNTIVREIADLNRMAKSISKIPIEDLRKQVPEIQRKLSVLRQRELKLLQELKIAEESKSQAHTDEKENEDRIANIEDLEKQIRLLEEKLDEIKEQNIVAFNRSGVDGKRAWLVDVSQDQIQAAALGGSEIKQFDGLQSFRIYSFLSWVNKLDKNQDYLLLLFRPSGADSFWKIYEGMSNSKVAFGTDLIEENQAVRFNEMGR